VKLKKQRGAALNEADKKTSNQFSAYKKFAAWYRKVAQRHGKVLAQLKSIEREQVESQMLQYWALMAEDKGKHYLVLVPKDKAQECNNYLKRAKGDGQGVKLYWFESFTYRSLQKLCFGNLENGSNAFYEGLSNDREMRKYIELDQRGYPKLISGEHEFKGDVDRVKCESVERFASRYPNADLGLYRPQVTEEQVRVAVSNALRLSDERVHFDHDYDLSDSTKLYCTEFVEHVYSLAGVSISQGRRTHITFPSLSGDHILPSDLTEGGNLKPIY
jgi:uncharacterized protein YifE (UPF0438 family)